MTLPFPTRLAPVTTTYLHLPSPAAFRPAFVNDPDLLILEAREPSVPFYRFLYDAVGRDWVWIDRLDWTDAQHREHLSRPTTTLLVLYYRGTPAGYIELDAAAGDETEIAYFGLMGFVHGRGFGKHLLSVGVQRAFDDGARRVWLHTARWMARTQSQTTWRAASFLTGLRPRTNPCPLTGSRPSLCRGRINQHRDHGGHRDHGERINHSYLPPCPP